MIITPSLKFTQKIINITFESIIFITTKIDASIKCGLGAISCCYCCLNKEMVNEYYYKQYDIIFGNDNILESEEIKYDTIKNLNNKIDNNEDVHDRIPEKSFDDKLFNHKKFNLNPFDYF